MDGGLCPIQDQLANGLVHQQKFVDAGAALVAGVSAGGAALAHEQLDRFLGRQAVRRIFSHILAGLLPAAGARGIRGK